MVVVVSQAAALPPTLQVFCAKEPLLSDAPLLVAFGPSGSNLNAGGSIAGTSRIQCHVFSPAGLQTYPRLAISPSSPLYSAVNCLSREDQGDEVCRILAYALNIYFSEFSDSLKTIWIQRSLTTNTRTTAALSLFTDSHAADVASRMVQVVEKKADLLDQLNSAFGRVSISHLDIDLILPNASIKELPNNRESLDYDYSNQAGLEARYGKYAELIELFGETAFIPTSRVRRAPSKPTAVNRSPYFTRDQKEALRKELCEFVDTEESYVGKVYDLVHGIAADFRKKASVSSATTIKSVDAAVAGLFPPSLDQILATNHQFLEAFRTILDNTESAAIADIEQTTPDSLDRAQEATSAESFADCLLEWLPKFADCYGIYLRAHTDFSAHLRRFMGETGSTFAQMVHETGEQHLMSMLIEPVQRLPRYSLYIDNILKQLPIRHRALKKFLKAKDIIADICAQDEPSSQDSILTVRLRSLIELWPSSTAPLGRLITALDATSMKAPFNYSSTECVGEQMIIAVFAHNLLVLRKTDSQSMSARGLLADLDKPTSLQSDDVAPQSKNLAFVDLIKLHELSAYVLGDGHLVRLICTNTSARPDSSVFTLSLKGAYEGKASRFMKDLTKARVEARFTEAERDSSKWEARDLDREDMNLGLFAAVFEQSILSNELATRDLASTRISFDPHKSAVTVPPNCNGGSIAVSVIVKGQGFYEVESSFHGEHRTRDIVTAAEFLPVLLKRLSTLSQILHQANMSAPDVAILQHYENIARSLTLPLKDRGRSESRTRSFRPTSHSPVKALTSLFSRENSSASTVKTTSTSAFASIPQLQLPSRSKSISDLHEEKQVSRSPSKSTIISNKSTNEYANNCDALEQTLATYVLALHARKGNVIGRSLANRAFADEAVTNELYNALLEDPTNHELAAQAPVDVLFCSFEKFLKNAWRDHMGPVLDLSTLTDMQLNSEKLQPLEYEDYLSTKISDLSPQNQRALKANIGLLVDLLEGMANDGDRGALMAAITKAIVCDGDSHDFMSLFDRFVEEHEVILTDNPRSRHGTPGSVSSSAARSGHTGSVSSKASSFSKRFGFGSLQRENSKSESPSKLGAVLRTWSKTGRSENSSRTLLSRTRSVELDSHPNILETAARPSAAEAFAEPASDAPPVDSEDIAATTPGLKPRKKRRSSLSDLDVLPQPNMSPLWSSPAFHGTGNTPRSNIRQAGSPLRRQEDLIDHSPLRTNSTIQKSPTKKEGTGPETVMLPSGSPRKVIQSVESFVSAPAQGRVYPRPSPSNIPVPRGVLSERPSSGNTLPPPLNINRPHQPSPTPSPSKRKPALTSQVDERARNQQEAVSSAHGALQVELDKIGAEINNLDLSRRTSTISRHGSVAKADQSAQILQLNNRVRAIETKYAHLLRNLTTHISSMEGDFKTALEASEKKAKDLESQLSDANAENDLLFERNNEELGRLFKRVKDGHGVEELKRKLTESQEETARLKKENALLKQQLASLKSS